MIRMQLLLWFTLLSLLILHRNDCNAQQEKAGKSSADELSSDKDKIERVAQLLDLLEEQNRGDDRFKDNWILTLKEIVEIGPVGVPQLIAELEATNDDMMHRSMGFCLRAIGDKRAVPALIRTIPKTLRVPGSDYGLKSDNKELHEFMRKNDVDTEELGISLFFARSVHEVLGAIQGITGHSFDDDQLYMVFVDGTARQRRMKEELFYRQAKKWADWWEANAAKLVKEEAYFKVNLPAREAPPENKLPKGKLQHFRIEGGDNNWILQPFSEPKARMVFFDFDTGRATNLPAKWKAEKDLDSKFAEVEKWAKEDGFDLMGAEFVSPSTGKKHYALRPLGLEVWELGEDRWKMKSADVTFESLISEGKAVSAWLLHRDQASQKFEPEKIATFLFRTKDGTPGLLYVGVEVHDDTQKQGIAVEERDYELDPVHFFKGRRFGFNFFEELPAE